MITDYEIHDHDRRILSLHLALQRRKILEQLLPPATVSGFQVLLEVPKLKMFDVFVFVVVATYYSTTDACTHCHSPLG
jgi:hypothetical protein